MRKRIMSLALVLVMLLSLMSGLSIPAHAAYEDGDECWNCGHYHWDEYMHECGACSPSCTNDWCALETHCHRCGGCLNGDYPCDECGLCKDCMAEMGHCSQCDSCWMDNGADDVLCGNCRRCEFCSPICPECHMCEDCASDPSDGMHCPDCGNCYQVTEQCQFVENNHCKDCCVPCDQCGECVAGDALETCPYCGLCVECCEFNSMMEGCEAGDICVYDSEWDEHICGVCLKFFQDTGDLCDTCVFAGEYRCKDCCEAASECSVYMCEYDDEYEEHFCVDCGECFHDVDRCESCAGAGEYRCEDCCAAIVSSMGCDCNDGWCFNDGDFEQHLTEVHEGGDDDHDCTPSNRWSFDETEHWRACRFCGEDTPDEVAEEHKDETAMPHKLDANGKCVTCGYVKGSRLSVARQPKSVSAKVSIAIGDESNPYHVKNNTVTLRTDAKVLNGNKDDLGFNWYARVTDQSGNEVFNGAVEEMFRNDCFKDEYKYGAIYKGFDSPELTISVPFRACQWKYSFWCQIDLVDSKGDVASTVTTDEVQIKASHLYTTCDNVAGSGSKTTWTYTDENGKKQVSTILSSDGHQWYCIGCRHTDKAIKTAKGRPVMHRYGTGTLRGESVDHPGAKVYAKQCQDCYHTTLYETHQHVYHTEESNPEKYNRGTFQVDEEKTTNMAHALVCLVGGCGHIKLESHEWDWRHMGYGSDAEGGGTFYRECRICGYPDYDYRPVDEGGNKINWTTKNVLVTAINAQVSRTLAVEGNRLTLTINDNSYTQGKRCSGWKVEYTTPDGTRHDITSAYTITQNEKGGWDTTIKLSGYTTGGILLFTPTMVDCTSHEYVTEGYVAPVCMYDGFAGYCVCKHCHTADPTDTRSDEERVIPAAGTAHTGTKQPLYQKEVTLPSGKKTITWTANKSESNGKRYNYKAGSCTEKGCEGDFLCSACQRVIPGKLEYKHPKVEERNHVDANCFRDGYTGDYFCTSCGKRDESYEKGHVISSTEYRRENHGKSTFFGGTETAATCTTAGKELDEFCYNCNYLVKAGAAIPALGHSWIKDEANCTETTIAYKCSRCDAAKIGAPEISRHSVTVDGGIAYTLSEDSPVTEAAVKKTVRLKATVPAGKDFKEWEVVSGGAVIADTTEPNGAAFTMPDDNVVINAVFADHIHAFTEKNTDGAYLAKKADCLNPASYYFSCTCGEKGSETFTAGAALGHHFVGGVCDRCGYFEPVIPVGPGKPEEPVKPEHPFTDVPSGSYYEDAVIWAVGKGITGGTSATTFDPNAACNRAQAVTFLWRAAGSPAPKSTTMPFTDVPGGSYYYDAVLWAVENGVTNGTSATTFSPGVSCNRAQIVTFLWRAQKSPAASAANPFTDVAADAYYTNAVLWAVKEGVTAGTTATTFSPAADCTRAQIVTFIYRALAD